MKAQEQHTNIAPGIFQGPRLLLFTISLFFEILSFLQNARACTTYMILGNIKYFQNVEETVRTILKSSVS